MVQIGTLVVKFKPFRDQVTAQSVIIYLDIGWFIPKVLFYYFEMSNRKLEQVTQI